MKFLELKKNQTDLLSNYGLENINQDYIRYINFSAGETIVRQESKIVSLYLIEKGRARVYTTARDGKILIIGYYENGDMLGEVELVTGQKEATTTICAISSVNAISIDYSFCKRELSKNIAFSNNINKMLAEKLVRSTIELTSSSLYSYRQRLIDYIIKNSFDGYFRSHLTETASSIGISYRHLLRLFKQLTETGALEKDKSGYIIKDMDKLLKYKED